MMPRAVVLFAVLMFPTAALAQLYGQVGSSKLTQSVELKLGPYTPAIDSDGGDAYEKIFGDESMTMFRFEYDWVLWRGTGGMVLFGGEVGYGQVSGSSLDPATGVAGADTTTFHMVPFALNFGYFLDTWGDTVPLVPYAKVGLDYSIWWVTNGVGDTATYLDSKGSGDTWGLHVSLGVRILLDFFAPKMATSFDGEAGVNNSYIFAEWFYGWDNDFASASSWQIGDSTAMFGLAFDF